MSDGQDVVHPIDRKMHEILAHIAETTTDPFLRHTALDLQLTLPPLKDWSDEQRGALSERYIQVHHCVARSSPE